jgi:hypothetical protein
MTDRRQAGSGLMRRGARGEDVMGSPVISPEVEYLFRSSGDMITERSDNDTVIRRS